MQYCTRNCINMMGHNSNEGICEFVRANCQQDTIDFIQYHFCIFKDSFMVLLTFGTAIMLFLFEAVSHLSNEFLAPCVENIVESFSIGETLAGVTFLAFANGAPDVLTAIIAGNSDSEDTALIPFGSIFGALMFSSTIILSQVILKSTMENGQTGLRVGKGDTIKPIIFYVGCTIIILIVSGAAGEMHWYYAVIFVIAYILYGIFVIVDERNRRRSLRRRRESAELSLPENQVKTEKKEQIAKQSLIENDSVQPEKRSQSNKSQNKISGDRKEDNKEDITDQMKDTKALEISCQTDQSNEQQRKPKKKGVYQKIKSFIEKVLHFIFSITIPCFDKQQWNFWKFSLQMFFGPLLVVLDQGALLEQINGLPIIGIAEMVAFVIVLTVYVFCGKNPPRRMWLIQLLSFALIVQWISLICSVIINFMELFMVVTNINSVYIGLTLLACGNSIGDYFSIRAFASKGKGMTAIAGVLSGQLFNFLIGFGLSMLIRSITKGPYAFNLFPSWGDVSAALDSSITWIVICFAMFNLTVILIYLIKQKFVFRKPFAVWLITLYVVFLGVTSLLAMVSDIVGQITCDAPTGI